MKKSLLILMAAFAFMQAQAQCWVQIEAGGYTTMGIKDDGTLWGWGYNWSGELGTTSAEYFATPIQIGADTDWAVISAGNGHNMALKNNGTLWTWGRNDFGQLGNNQVSNYQYPVPTQVGTDADWAYISAGHVHSTAIKTNGTLWAWGDNYDGQLGQGTTDDLGALPQTIVPTQIGSDTDWQSISASLAQNAAIKTNATLWVWGTSAYTPMIGGETVVLQPAQIGTDTNWKDVAVGGFGFTALKQNGTLWSWGFNFSGGVGDGTNIDRVEPVAISSESWTSINRGMNYFASAIKKDGSLWTWGYNYYGAVGDGTVVNKNTPTQIASDGRWLAYSGAGDFSTALKEDGSLWVWGYNWNNELGFDLDGNTVLTPAQVATCAATAGVVQNQLQTLSIYPNPAKDVININNPAGIPIENVSVYDVTGKLVLQQTAALTINVQQLPQGMYLLKATTGQGVQTYKFIKQ